VSRRLATRAVLFATLLVFLGACERIAYYSVTGAVGPGGQPDDAPSNGPATTGAGSTVVTRAEVVDGVATCALKLYAEVSASTESLKSASAQWEADPNEVNATSVRAAWANAMGLWQQAEVLRFGPAGPVALPSGEGLRDYIYSWPLVSRCLVEQNLVSKKYAQDSFIATALVNTRGFNASEYLIFYEPNENQCSASATINTSGSWADLGAAELASRKRSYSAVLSADIHEKAAAIEAKWKGDDGFARLLQRAGASGSPFDSDQSALNVISDGMFYLEREVKDMKLGRPLGKTADCTEAICPEMVESLYARVSRDHIRNNLLGFRRVFEGCDVAPDTGFDDLLRSLGSADLADRMRGDLAAAIATADALPSADIGALLASDRSAVEGLHAAVKRITDTLKTDFVTVLDLELPKTIEGDND
jgi:uncharacterized protein